jgi:hypothetical protein
MSRVADAKQFAVNAAKKYVYEQENQSYGRSELDKLLEPEDHEDTWTLAQAAGLCLLDQIGVGGNDGVSGAGTTRLPCFAECGKGRKQASDGGAWDAAIEAAERELADNAGYFGRMLSICPIRPEDGLWNHDQKSWGRKEGGIGVILPDNEPWANGRPDFTPIPVPNRGEDVAGRTLYDYSWHWSLARECLRRTAGMKSWFPEVYIDVQGTAADWSAVVNELSRIRKLDEVEHCLISYWWNHRDEERKVEKLDGGRETWITAKIVCERSKVPGILVVGVDHEDIVPTLDIKYRQFAEKEWWELR